MSTLRQRLIGFAVLALLAARCHLALGQDWNPPAPNPAELVDYAKWLNEKLGARVSDNAAPLYLKAFEAFTPFDGDWNITISRTWKGHAPVADWLKANDDALDTFRSATCKPDCYFAPEFGSGALLDADNPNAEVVNQRLRGSVLTSLVSHLSQFRHAGKALIAQGFQMLAGGDEETFRRNIAAVLKASQHLRARSSTSIQLLVADALSSLAYRAALSGLACSRDPANMAVDLLDDLDSVSTELPSQATAAQLEHVMARDVVQRMFVPAADGGKNELSLPVLMVVLSLSDNAATEPNAPRNEGALALAAAGYDATIRQVDEAFAALDTWWVQPYHVAAANAEHLDRSKDALGQFVRRAFIAQSLRCRKFDERCCADGRATLLILHIFAHRQAKGSFPATLGELDAPDLATIRTDPFSGHDFVYKPDPAGFTLHTVAGNFRDDAGQHSARFDDSDHVYWPVQSD